MDGVTDWYEVRRGELLYGRDQDVQRMLAHWMTMHHSLCLQFVSAFAFATDEWQSRTHEKVMVR